MDENSQIKLTNDLKKISKKTVNFDRKNKSINSKVKNLVNKTVSGFCSKNENAIKHININDKQKSKKQRNPGIDLYRLIAMYGVVMNHLLYVHGADKKYPRYSRYLKIIHILTGWHNNGFALISGIVGYKSCGYANLIYLWLYVEFYTLGIPLYYKYIKKDQDITAFYIKDKFPIIFNKYWYFTAYFGISIFLPIVNKGISIISRFQFTLVVIGSIGLFVIWRDIQNPQVDVFKMNYGMSFSWVFTLYFTGAYIGKYNAVYKGFKKYIFCIICAFIFLYSNYLYYKVLNNELDLGNGYYQRKIIEFLKINFTDRYDGLLKITTSITAALFFMQIHYNKYIAKFLSILGPLVFSVYIIHENNYIKNKILFQHTFEHDPVDLSLKSAMILVLLKGLKICFYCMIIDYFRNLLFSILKIKQICVFLENRINRIFS